jgi:sulfur-oxidizing protein SoxA
MTRNKLLGGGAIGALAIAIAGVVSADIGDDEQLIVNGEIEMIIETAAPEHLQDHLPTIYSGWVFRSDETQEMQSDDFINPAMIYVDQAMEDFNTVMGSEGNSCASCHTPEDFEMVRATYPRWDEDTSAVQTVEMQVIECQTDRMGMEEPFGYNSQEMRNMTALIASVGRGQVVNVAIDGPAQSTWEQGKEIYYTRFGQLELSCANCHETTTASDDPRRPPEPGSDQRLPDLPSEARQADLAAQPLPRLHPRHAGRDLLEGQPRIRGARALRRLARQRPVGRRSGGPQLRLGPPRCSRGVFFA